ncbi:MAG: hypothetical protein IJ177_05590 [Fibrobacter sp.]|uniref:hypothetical protein n=1 Tax=Fibrobacter sp. TaxID=35828 RepID=UPI0025B973C9|nr:hypothetical protein [Fibrobacter sp.]MBQ9225645.1 hypothetical protein [Fibrobacter sp.]
MAAESKILERAEMYLRKLACGVNPLTEETLPENDTCRQERISKCLLYVADYLQQIVCPKPKAAKAEKPLTPKRKREQANQELALTEETLAKFEFSEEPLSLSGIVRRVNSLIPEGSGMMPLMYADVAEVLTQEGYLQKQEGVAGKETNLPTPQGEEKGFVRAEADIRGHFSIYTKCNVDAQKFVIENIQKAVAQANARLARRNAERAAREASGIANATGGRNEFAGARAERAGKEKFHLTEAQIGNFAVDESPLPVSEIARRLNALLPEGANIEQLYFKKIRDWFVAQGLLEERRSVVGKVSFSPTEQGLAAGILVDKRIGKNGEEYEAVLYNAAAQKLVLDHVNELA